MWEMVLFYSEILFFRDSSRFPPNASCCSAGGEKGFAYCLAQGIKLLFFFTLCLPFSYYIASFDTNENENKLVEPAFLLPIKI